jgi:AraC-like DNA-binding protein
MCNDMPIGGAVQDAHPISEAVTGRSQASLMFSSDDRPPRDRFEAYHDLYAGGSDVTLQQADFHARVKAFRFERMLVFERHLSGLIHERSQTRVRRDGFDHITLHFIRAGHFIGGPIGEERVVAPGEVILFDTTRPQRTVVQDAQVVTISLAREIVEAKALGAINLHGTILAGARGGLVADFMASLARRSAQLTQEGVLGPTWALGELLGIAVGVSRVMPATAVRMRLERAEAYIDANLANPRLSAETIAAATAVSRTILYEAFAPVGGVARYILQRRLTLLRKALCRITERRNVAELIYAHGFSNESYGSRAFRQAFGMPPGQFRAETINSRLGSEAKTGEEETFSCWHSELF